MTASREHQKERHTGDPVGGQAFLHKATHGQDFAWRIRISLEAATTVLVANVFCKGILLSWTQWMGGGGILEVVSQSAIFRRFQVNLIEYEGG